MNALVLGIGNILLRDEGVGVKVVEELERRYQFPPTVEVVDGGTSGMELLSRLDNKEHLILIDAVKSGHPRGWVDPPALVWGGSTGSATSSIAQDSVMSLPENE